MNGKSFKTIFLRKSVIIAKTVEDMEDNGGMIVLHSPFMTSTFNERTAVDVATNVNHH